MVDAVRMVAELVSVDPATVTHATPLVDLAGWDSIKMVRLVMGLEQTIGRELNDEELETLSTVGNVATLLRC